MDVYTYRHDLMTVGSLDIAGYDVEAEDGRIGTIDEATYETSASCLVVDTGFWIFGKKRMIPAGVVRRIDPDARTVHVAMTKDEIKGAPDFDPDRHGADEQAYHDEVGGYYEPHRVTGEPR